ncbi:MAG TPA: hypothetical protein VFM46_18520, partial [Pseudomonadales bacterium]|nr:hypothetical protein [Pseudomonadales bacterium]
GALKNDVSINQAYNVGGADRKVGEFFKAVAEVLPNKPKIVPIPLPITIGLDNSKAEREIGFRNRPFSESMREVAKEELV